MAYDNDKKIKEILKEAINIAENNVTDKDKTYLSILKDQIEIVSAYTLFNFLIDLGIKISFTKEK